MKSTSASPPFCAAIVKRNPVTVLGLPRQNGVAVFAAESDLTPLSGCSLHWPRPSGRGPKFFDRGVTVSARLGDMIEVDIGRRYAGMAEKTLDLLQRIAREEAIAFHVRRLRFAGRAANGVGSTSPAQHSKGMAKPHAVDAQ